MTNEFEQEQTYQLTLTKDEKETLRKALDDELVRLREYMQSELDNGFDVGIMKYWVDEYEKIDDLVDKVRYF